MFLFICAQKYTYSMKLPNNLAKTFGFFAICSPKISQDNIGPRMKGRGNIKRDEKETEKRRKTKRFTKNKNDTETTHD